MFNSKPTTEELLSYHYTDKYANYQTSRRLFQILHAACNQDIVFLCIGTDRATGDSLGPLVGTRLLYLLPDSFIYGTLENPVHAVNLEEELRLIRQSHKNPLVIAIDACLGNIKHIGHIQLKPGALCPGSALNKHLPQVGDYHLVGTVNIGGFCESLVLQSTRLHLVYSMANAIAHIISSALFRLRSEHRMVIRQP